MTYIIVLFGLLTLLAGMIILIRPEIIFGALEKNIEYLWVHVTAVGVRLALGTLLLLSANESKFPTIITVLGWMSIAAAVTFVLIGRQRFIGLMNMAFSLLKPYGRVGGIFAAAFGGFIVYAFL